jgi:putative PIN family toxin of toxin-antitoxin system
MADEAKPPRVVVDTNILVSAVIAKQGNPNRLLRAWQQGTIQILTAPILIAEVDRTLHLPRIRRKYPIDEEEVQSLVEALQTVAQVQPQEELPLVSRDAKDNPLLAVALGGQADYLVTGDEDLLVLAGDAALGALQIVTVRDFLATLS